MHYDCFPACSLFLCLLDAAHSPSIKKQKLVFSPPTYKDSLFSFFCQIIVSEIYHTYRTVLGAHRNSDISKKVQTPCKFTDELHSFCRAAEDKQCWCSVSSICLSVLLSDCASVCLLVLLMLFETPDG